MLQVAHISTTNDYDDQHELSIQECLAKYLNLPSNFFDSSVSNDCTVMERTF